jgi:hypothetical protein
MVNSSRKWYSLLPRHENSRRQSICLLFIVWKWHLSSLIILQVRFSLEIQNLILRFIKFSSLLLTVPTSLLGCNIMKNKNKNKTIPKILNTSYFPHAGFNKPKLSYIYIYIFFFFFFFFHFSQIYFLVIC